MDMEVEAFSTLNNFHQLNNCSVYDSTYQSYIYDGASHDRAVKCCISNHYHHNNRRRIVNIQTDKHHIRKYH